MQCPVHEAITRVTCSDHDRDDDSSWNRIRMTLRCFCVLCSQIRLMQPSNRCVDSQLHNKFKGTGKQCSQHAKKGSRQKTRTNTFGSRCKAILPPFVVPSAVAHRRQIWKSRLPVWLQDLINSDVPRAIDRFPRAFSLREGGHSSSFLSARTSDCPQ